MSGTRLWTASLLLVVIAACGPTASESPTPSSLPSAPSEVVAPPSPTALSTSPSPEAGYPFQLPRASMHRILLSAASGQGQAIFAYDVESNITVEVLELPDGLTPRVGVTVAHETSSSSQPAITSLPIPAPWLELSPNGLFLLVLQPAIAGEANYLNELDLISGEAVRLKLMEGYRWTIPTVPGRVPGFPSGGGRPEDYRAVDQLIYNLKWSPDSSGYIFTIGENSPPLLGEDPRQLYYVTRGSTEPTPLASIAEGITVGHIATWSPDSRYIFYLRDPLLEGIWLLDVSHPEDAFKIAPSYLPDQVLWSPDGRGIFYAELARLESGQIGSRINYLEVPFGVTNAIASVEKAEDETVAFEIVGATPDLKSLVAYERHSVAEDPYEDFPEYRYDPSRSRLVTIDIQSRAVTPSLQAQPVSSLFISPSDPLVAVMPEVGSDWSIVDAFQGTTIQAPLGLRGDAVTWSPDGHMLVVEGGGSILIYDLDSGTSDLVSPELEGERLFLGWLQDPSMYDAIFSPD